MNADDEPTVDEPAGAVSPFKVWSDAVTEFAEAFTRIGLTLRYTAAERDLTFLQTFVTEIAGDDEADELAGMLVSLLEVERFVVRHRLEWETVTSTEAALRQAARE